MLDPSQQGRSRNMFRAIAAIGILQILTILVQVVRAKAISVELGPVGLGVVGLIDQLVILIATVCALSLPTVVLRVMPRVYGGPEFGRQYASFLQAVVIASVLGAAVLGVVLAVQPSALGEVPAKYATEFGIALVSVPLFAVGLLLPNVLAASMRPVGAAWLSFGIAAMATIAALVGMLLGGIREIYIWQALATAALLVAALVYFKARLHLPLHDRSAGLLHEIRARPDIIPNVVAVYASLVGAAFSLLVVRYVTANSLGTEIAGWLQSILSMVLAVSAVMVAMASRYLLPVLSRPSPLEEKFATFDLFRRRQLLIMIALTVPLVIFAKVALIILFSSKFIAAAAWLPAFLVWQLLYIQTNVQLQLLFALDELWIVTIKSIAGCVLSALLCVFLIPTYGLSGGAAAMIAGTALTLAIGALRLRRHGYVIGAPSLLLGAYAVVALLIAPYFASGNLVQSIALKLVACTVLIGGLWPFLSAKEKSFILQHARRRANETVAN
jgi:O-antigen/teichoic acid export membrane protein